MFLAFKYYRVCRTQDQAKLPSVLELSWKFLKRLASPLRKQWSAEVHVRSLCGISETVH